MPLEHTAMILYYAMMQNQYAQVTQRLDQFHQDTSKYKRLYEVQISCFDLVAFERPSHPQTYCVHRNLLDALVISQKHSRSSKASLAITALSLSLERRVHVNA